MAAVARKTQSGAAPGVQRPCDPRSGAGAGPCPFTRYRVLLLVLALVLGPGLALGLGLQEGPPTVEQLEAWLKELEPAGDGAVETGTPNPQALPLREALTALQDAAEIQAATRRVVSETAEAPALILALVEELAQPALLPDMLEDQDLDLHQLAAQHDRAQAELVATRARVEELERLNLERVERRVALPEAQASAAQELAAAREILAAIPEGEQDQARRWLQLARVEVLNARVQALDAESAFLEARRELLPLRRARWSRRAIAAERVAMQWKARVEARRTAEGEAAAKDATQRLEDIGQRFKPLEPLAKRYGELTAMRSGEEGLPRRIARARAALEDTEAEAQELARRFASARRRIEAGGLRESTALLLRSDFEWLPSLRDMRAKSIEREGLLSTAQLELITIEEEATKLEVQAATAETTLAELGIEEVGDALLRETRELLSARDAAIRAAQGELEQLTSLLVDHEEAAQHHQRAVEEYGAYIEKRILWVRSASLDTSGSVLALPAHAAKLVGTFPLSASAQGLVDSAREHLGACVSIGLLLIALVALRGLGKRRRRDLGTLVRSYRTDRYAHTVRALAQSLALALPLPLCAWTLGWLFASSTDKLVGAVGSGLREIAMIWLCLRLLRELLTDKGVGSAHFKWPSESVAALRAQLRWLEPLVVVLGFVALSLDRQPTTEWSDSIGRLCFIVCMLALSLVCHRLLRKGGGLWSGSREGLIGRTHQVWAFVARVLPLALAMAAALGYYYTALQFELRLRYSVGLVLALVLANSLLMRWLFIARRRLAVSQALEARARREEEVGDAPVTESGTAPLDADKVDIPAVDAQTRQLFKSSLTLATMLGLYFIWAGVLPALQGLDRIQLLPELAVLADGPEVAAAAPLFAPTQTPGAEGAGAVGSPVVELRQAVEERAGESALGLPATLTLADVLLALIFLVLTTIAARNLPALLELSLLQRLPIDTGARFAVATIVRYLILIVGLSAISGALGVGWHQVQWLAAALTFGLAFGLQEIFANFASGLIILIERPIRVGDIVTVGTTEGRVTQLRMRATTILDWDRREYLVPNKEFITGNVINWTLSDPVTRVILPVGIAYGSDTKKARSLLLEAARKSKLVLDDPPPSAIFRRFGESSLDFELRVFMASRDLWPEVMDKLHTRIDDAFRAAKIEIAFPQRDLHLRSMVEWPERGPAEER